LQKESAAWHSLFAREVCGGAYLLAVTGKGSHKIFHPPNRKRRKSIFGSSQEKQHTGKIKTAFRI